MIKSGDQVILIGGENKIDGQQIKSIEARDQQIENGFRILGKHTRLSFIKVYDIRTGRTSGFAIDQIFFGSACIDLNKYILVCGGMDRVKFTQSKACWRIYDRKGNKNVILV